MIGFETELIQTPWEESRKTQNHKCLILLKLGNSLLVRSNYIPNKHLLYSISYQRDYYAQNRHIAESMLKIWIVTLMLIAIQSIFPQLIGQCIIYVSLFISFTQMWMQSMRRKSKTMKWNTFGIFYYNYNSNPKLRWLKMSPYDFFFVGGVKIEKIKKQTTLTAMKIGTTI